MAINLLKYTEKTLERYWNVILFLTLNNINKFQVQDLPI